MGTHFDFSHDILEVLLCVVLPGLRLCQVLGEAPHLLLRPLCTRLRLESLRIALLMGSLFVL